MLATALSNYVDGSAAAKREFRSAVKVSLRRSAIMVTNDIKQSMKGNRFGKSGSRVTGQRYNPAPPGEPPAVQTGNLASKITYDTTDIDRLTVRVGTNVKYGKYLELGGRKPYTIVPKNGKVLSFVVNGKRIFTKRVVHPPLKARPFLRPALQRNQGKIDAAWSEVVNRFKWRAV